MAPSVAPNICPTCGDANECGLSQGKAECWCFSVQIAPSAIDQIPVEAKDTVCICPRCAAKKSGAEPA